MRKHPFSYLIAELFLIVLPPILMLTGHRIFLLGGAKDYGLPFGIALLLFGYAFSICEGAMILVGVWGIWTTVQLLKSEDNRNRLLKTMPGWLALSLVAIGVNAYLVLSNFSGENYSLVNLYLPGVVVLTPIAVSRVFVLYGEIKSSKKMVQIISTVILIPMAAYLSFWIVDWMLQI